MRAIPAYAANFERMGVKPVETAIGVPDPASVPAALARWRGAVDEVVLRAITAKGHGRGEPGPAPRREALT